MEQSIKSVLVKQTIAHQQQQLTNLQVSAKYNSTVEGLDFTTARSQVHNIKGTLLQQPLAL